MIFGNFSRRRSQTNADTITQTVKNCHQGTKTQMLMFKIFQLGVFVSWWQNYCLLIPWLIWVGGNFRFCAGEDKRCPYKRGFILYVQMGFQQG